MIWRGTRCNIHTHLSQARQLSWFWARFPRLTKLSWSVYSSKVPSRTNRQAGGKAGVYHFLHSFRKPLLQVSKALFPCKVLSCTGVTVATEKSLFHYWHFQDYSSYSMQMGWLQEPLKPLLCHEVSHSQPMKSYLGCWHLIYNIQYMWCHNSRQTQYA